MLSISISNEWNPCHPIQLQQQYHHHDASITTTKIDANALKMPVANRVKSQQHEWKCDLCLLPTAQNEREKPILSISNATAPLNTYQVLIWRGFQTPQNSSSCSDLSRIL